jgi:hypothetical protein
MQTELWLRQTGANRIMAETDWCKQNYGWDTLVQTELWLRQTGANRIMAATDWCKQNPTSNNQTWGITGIIMADKPEPIQNISIEGLQFFHQISKGSDWNPMRCYIFISQSSSYFMFHQTSLEWTWNWTDPNWQLYCGCVFLQKLSQNGRCMYFCEQELKLYEYWLKEIFTWTGYWSRRS